MQKARSVEATRERPGRAVQARRRARRFLADSLPISLSQSTGHHDEKQQGYQTRTPTEAFGNGSGRLLFHFELFCNRFGHPLSSVCGNF